jgi:hypothetical protein
VREDQQDLVALRDEIEHHLGIAPTQGAAALRSR